MRTGDILADRFEIEHLAEKGGMGAVYRAKDLTTGEPVAIKVLHPYARGEANRMVREAHALMKLRHPGIVRYVHHGTLEDELPYIAMEWLDGEDLRQRRRRQELGLGETMALGFRVAEALAHAHDMGIVHRDIKPSNLFLCGGQVSQVKLLDFGVARIPEPAREATAFGAMLGTIAYMAPEQARGAREVTPLADVFSLGCVLYECATGQRAFVGDDAMAVLAKVLVTELPRPRTINTKIPRALDHLIMRMLSKDPIDRLTSAEVARTLEGLADRTATASVSEPPVSSMKVPVLSGVERRVASIVVVRPTEEPDSLDEPTFSDSVVTTQVTRLKHLFGESSARVEKLADGTVLAIVAGKTAAQDQALVAAQCALQMRAELPEGAMSLVTGSGEVSGGQWVGESLERAAALVRAEERRLQSLSTPPKRLAVRTDDVTAALLGGRAIIDKDEHGALLVGLRTGDPGARTLLGRPSPFVGRERELALLQSTLEECAADPVTRAIIMTGPAGSGKSRLLRELRDRIPPDTTVWIARGDPMRHKSPFGMLRQILRRTADLQDNEPVELSRQKLLSRVRRAEVDPAEAPRIAEFLGEIVGVPFPDHTSPKLRSARSDTMLMGDQMRRAWEDFAFAECDKQPVLLVLEDLQWGDLATVKLIDALLRQEEKALFVLALARPGALSSFSGLLRGSRVMELALADLSKRASERFAREVLGPDVPAETISKIAEHASGNAFFLEELIRAHAESRGGEVPDTVLAMVRTRLENMENDARRLLRAASIFGTSFWQGGVESLLGTAPKSKEITGWLSELCERELITMRERGRFAGQEEYTFRQSLVREAAYAMLTDENRTLGHRLAGEWLAAAGERDAASLANHFELGEDYPQAASYYLRAAEQALEGNDLEAALASVERGLHCGASGEARGALHLIAAEAYRFKGEPSREQISAIEAMELLPKGDTRWCIAAGQAAIASGKLGDRKRLLSVANELLELGREGRASGRMVVAAARASIPLLLAGQREPAEGLLSHVEQHGDAIAWSDPGVAAWIHLARGTHAAEAGEPISALSHMKSAASRFEEAGDVRGASAQAANIGWTSIELGEVEYAESVLREGLDRAIALGLSHVESNIRLHLGLLVGRKGEYTESKAIINEAILGFQGGDNHRMEAMARRALAEILSLEGNIAAAESEALLATELGRQMPPIRAYALATYSDVLRALGRLPEALHAAEEAIRFLGANGQMVQGGACVHAAWIETLRATGRKEDAEKALETAREWLAARAARFDTEEQRERFLSRVPDNARLLKL